MKYIFIILALFATQLQAQRSDCNGPKITLPKFSDTDAIKNGVLYLTERNNQCTYLYCASEQCVRVKRYRSNYCNIHAMKRIVQTKVIYSQTCGFHMGNNIYCPMLSFIGERCLLHDRVNEKPLPIRKQ